MKMKNILPSKELTAPNLLIIFARYPQAGKVKKRLAATLGRRNAATLYRSFVETILANTRSRSFDRLLFYTPAEKKEDFAAWLGKEIPLCSQEGDNLGERLSSAFARVFEKEPRRAVVIGTDSPLIDRKTVLEAFRKLENRDCVVGPSEAGGYYLLGLSHFLKDIFRNIDWGTEKVLGQTVENLRKLNVRYSLLKEHFDVDTGKDLVKLAHSLEKMKRKDSPGLLPLKRVLNEVIGRGSSREESKVRPKTAIK